MLPTVVLFDRGMYPNACAICARMNENIALAQKRVRKNGGRVDKAATTIIALALEEALLRAHGAQDVPKKYEGIRLKPRFGKYFE